MPDNQIQIDAFTPQIMANRMEMVGVSKTELKTDTMFALAILAGAFIACGAIFATVVTTGLGAVGMGYGVIKLLGGLVFCLGLIAVVVAGAELFTGNNLIIMAFASKRVSFTRVMRNWIIVYIGNLVGSILTALVMLATKQYMSSGGALGANALGIANTKCELDFMQAMALGIMCNALVCLSVWLTSSARSTTDKILAIIFPITAFVAAGFEHSVANMYFIPIGLFIKQFAVSGFWEAIGKTAADYGNLTWGAFFLKNLLPVTIGNIIGGSGFVGLVYWFIYLRPQKKVEVKEKALKEILVVDDDPDIHTTIQTLLAKEGGYHISSARNGEEALQTIKAKTPHLILLDVMMATPLEGVNLAQKLSADSELSTIPIIMISSIESSEYKNLIPDNMRLPIDSWISKPLDPDHLIKTIRRFFS